MIMKIAKQKIFIYLIAIFVILSHSVYAYLSNRLIVNGIYGILSILPVLFCVINRVKLPKRRRYFPISVIYILIVILYGLLSVNIDNIVSYICRYVIFLPCMTLVFISLNNSGDELVLFQALSNLMLIIAYVSLFFWLFGTTLHIISPSGTIWSEWGHAYRNIYFGIYLEVPGRISGTSLNRNVGIFCEGPAYALFLSIAYTFDELVKMNSNKLRKLIYILTIISTGTTTGLLVLLYTFFANYWTVTRKKTSKNLIKRMFLIIIAVFLAELGIKFAFSDSKMGSIVLRISDYVNGITAWIHSPWIGYGYMVDSAGKFNAGFSNSISQVMIAGGILLASIYAIPFLGMVYSLVRTKKSLYLNWVIILGILFGISIAGYAYCTLVILAFEYALLVSPQYIKSRR